MYEKVPLKTIMILVTTAILIVPWAALQHSHAQSDLANTALAVHNRERARRWIFAPRVERRASRRG